MSQIPDRKQAPATDTASPPVAREWFSDLSGLGTESIVITDPERDEAFRSVCNPSWHWAECQARGWAAEVGLVVGEAERRRLGRMGQGRMAGYLAPSAGPAEVGLLARWGAFIALVDDGFDQDTEQGRPERVRVLLDQLVAVVSEPPRAVRSPVPAVRALAELWQSTADSASPGWTSRFAGHYARFAEATYQEARWRETGTPLSLEEYLELRRHTITVFPLLDVVERAQPGEAALEGLREATADTIAWTNDLASAGRERREGHDNLVSVLAREHRCDRDEAAAITRAMISRRMDDFDVAATAVLAAGPWQAGLRPRVQAIRAFRDGALSWQGETHRNRTGESKSATPDSGGATTATAPAMGTGTGTGALDGRSRLRTGIDRLARHLALAVAPGGAIPDHCASRVLESALLLALLRTRNSHQAEQRRLAGYLQERRPHSNPIDVLLIDACLNPATVATQVDDATAALSSGLDRVGGRGELKRVMLQVVLHLLGGAPLQAQDTPPAMAPDRIPTFTDVNILALRCVYARASGSAHAVSVAERFRLLELLGSGKGRLLWEASATTHLLALHAVQTFWPAHSLITEGITSMLLVRNGDGGLPFLDSQDLWLAAVAGLAFHDNTRLRPLTVRMAQFVASWQDGNGAWPFASGMVQTDVDTTCRCLEFLQALDPRRYHQHGERAARYLTTMATPTGGFPTWVREDPPDVDMTAGVVIALAPRWQLHRPLLEKSLGFLLDAQRGDGTFEPSWTISESSVILRVLDALSAVPDPAADLAVRIEQATARAVAHLVATQNPDGGWGQHSGEPSDVLSTAQAVPALAGRADPTVLRGAVGYLLDQQHDDGSFTSVPDQVGPRPLPFDFPVLASIHALAALSRASTLSLFPDLSPRGGPLLVGGRCGADADWSLLAAQLRGRLLRPTDGGYEQARLVRNRRFDHVRPQAIARVTDERDVAICLSFVAQRDIPVALRSGGNNHAGFSTGAGLVIDVRALDTVTVTGDRVRIGAGASSISTSRALARAGVGIPVGRWGTVGVCGLTLGGGKSAFTRAWGLACDRLTAATIVTADGAVRHITPDGPDAALFWALRGGGGGNFGVVTTLEFRPVDIRRACFTHFLLEWPYHDKGAVIRGWQHWLHDPRTPREVYSDLQFIVGPGASSLPTVHGAAIGTPEALRPALQRLIALVGRPQQRLVITPRDYPSVAMAPDNPLQSSSSLAADEKDRLAWAGKSHIVREPMTDTAIATLIATIDVLRHSGGTGGVYCGAFNGAMTDIAPHDSAFPHRRALAIQQYLAIWDQTSPPTQTEGSLLWLRTTHAALQVHLGTGAYVNYPDPELLDWEHAYYGDNYPRLQQVKATYDPDRLFDFPQAVTPAPGRH